MKLEFFITPLIPLLTKQRLVVTAADTIFTTNGPDKGYVCQSDIGLIIASESVVANDMVSLAWLLCSINEICQSQRNSFSKTLIADNLLSVSAITGSSINRED